MLKYEILNLKADNIKLFDIETIIIPEIEKIIQQFDLRIDLKTTLSTKKGSIHWHVKRGIEKGVLEITYWPKKNQLWVEIHDNRVTKWNLECIEPFSNRLAELFGGTVMKIGQA